MFRPAHFVILFAVVLYANAFPADPLSLAPEESGKAPEAGELKNLPSTLPAPAPGAKPIVIEYDRKADGTVHYKYNYNYGPRSGSGPGGIIGWGFGIAKDADSVPPHDVHAPAPGDKPGADEADRKTDGTVHQEDNSNGPRSGCGPGRTIGCDSGIAKDADSVPPHCVHSLAPVAKPGAVEYDRKADGTVHWKYNYNYGPRSGCGPGRTTGWGFGIAKDADSVPPYPVPKFFHQAN